MMRLKGEWRFSGEKGIALITALLFMALGLAVALASFYMMSTGMRVSSIKKFYHTALEASHGGVELTTKEVIPKIISGTATADVSGDYTEVTLTFSSGACLNTKLTTSLSSGWGICSSTLTNLSTTSDISITFTGIASQPNYNVFAKIVDTVQGNSDSSPLDLIGGGVVKTLDITTPSHNPYIYRIEVQGQRATGADERANLTVLFAY